MPTISGRISPVRDIVEPTPNEQVRAEYLERHMRQMGSISILPSDMPSLEDELVQRQDKQRKKAMSEEEYNRSKSQQPVGIVVPDNLQERVQNYCWENKVKRKQEWESHRMALERMKESNKQQQQIQQEQDAVYALMLQDLKQTRAAVRSSISKASTISDEECQLGLTEDDFLTTQWKMDKIDQKLNDLYSNWQVEYKNAINPKDCDEVKRFYKPYLEKYESKYRILYQMLQQSNRQTDNISVPSAQEHTPNITPSLAALDDAQTLMRKEWRRGEPGEDTPRQYSTLCGYLTPTHPRHEDMRMDSTLKVTLEGSLSNIPAATRGNINLTEAQQELEAPETKVVSTHPSTTMLDCVEETPYTSVKVMSDGISDRPRAGQADYPKRVQRMREASQEDALVSARHSFALENGLSWVVSLDFLRKCQLLLQVELLQTLPLLLLFAQFLLLPLPLQSLELRQEVLDPFF